MLKLLQQNKSLAVIVVLILVVILYLRFGRKNVATKEKASNKTTGKSRGSRGKSPARGSRSGGAGGGDGGGGKGKGRGKPEKASGRKPNINKRTPVQEKQTVDIHNDDDSSASEDEDIREDAEELYNLVHEGMCSGMQQSEFEQAVDDLADAFIFIELKQLYNQCSDKNMDPEKAITINDYIRVLKREE